MPAEGEEPEPRDPWDPRAGGGSGRDSAGSGLVPGPEAGSGTRAVPESGAGARPVPEAGSEARPMPEAGSGAGLASENGPAHIGALRAVPSARASQDAEPAPDLVAADTAVASRLFTADRVPGKLSGRTVVLPFTTVAELATWPERLLWGHSRTEELCLWIDSRRMILGDETVARIWGRITVAAQRAGNVLPVNDAWVAAGCLSYGLPLATLDVRPYRYLADRYGLELL